MRVLTSFDDELEIDGNLIYGPRYTEIFKSSQITLKKFVDKLKTFLRLFSHYSKVRIKSRDEIIKK